MTALALLRQLHALGVTLTPYPDGTLHYKAPKGTLTPGLREAMRKHKEGLHGLVEKWNERAAIGEYCGELTRAEAEQLAWHCVLGQRCHCDPDVTRTCSLSGHHHEERHT